MLGIYARVSKDDDSNESSLSIQNQIKFGEKFAKKNGYTNIKIYSDDGISGTTKKTEQRKKFNELISDIEAGLITAVWYNDQDRFERSQATRFFLKELVKKNNLIVYEGDKKVNFQDAEQVFFGDLRSLMNEYYTIIGSQKITKVKKQNAEDGKSNGALPYGYTTDEKNKIIINDEESKIIENIFQWYLAGDGVSTIARKLNERNVRLHKKSNATKWNQTVVWRILKNSFYKGERNYGGNKYNNIDPIVNPLDWEQVQLQLEKNKSNTGRKVKDKYILRGLLKCGICGRNYYGRSGTTSKSNYYFCSSIHEMRLDNCINKGISHYYLDEVIFQIAYVFSKSKEKDKSIEDLKNEIINKNKELKVLSKLKEDIKKERLKLVNAIVKFNLEESDTKAEFQRIKENENKINSDILECEKLIYNLNNLITDFSLDTNKLISTFSQ